MTSALYRANYDLIDWSQIKEQSKPHQEKRASSDRASFHIIKDIEPYQNIIDGKTIGGRRQHREFLRQHGVEEVGNEKPKPRPKPDNGKEIQRDAIEAFQMVRDGYKPRLPGTYKEE